MKLLARLGVRVVFALDKEVNIKKDHNINKLKQYVNVEYVWDKDNLLEEKDAPVVKGERYLIRFTHRDDDSIRYQYMHEAILHQEES